MDAKVLSATEKSDTQSLTPAETNRRWHFAGAVFDARSLELRVGTRPIRLNRKPLLVLQHLLQHAGEVVTKDELAQACWPGRILSETVLSTTMNRLRAGLGEPLQDLIKTVHGFGYRLDAEVHVEWDKSREAPSRVKRSVGDHPPLRPTWVLERPLGSGGSADVWLARQAQTGDRRAFKFAGDQAGLRTLKREITLFRLLKESLGEHSPSLRILDWNLELPPFFIETEFKPAGSLAQWTESQGGLGALPIDSRLELIAQCADLLAAAHSVGVLHKDLKPANVLIDQACSPIPRLKLTDFGCGALADPEQIEQLEITRLGFTLQDDTRGNSGTPLYAAPEVLSGQPATLRSDIYALGVMLFQVVVGDWQARLSPGWERKVDDPLLRDDIAVTIDGDPRHRLGDAGELAQRLRALPKRRQRAADEREATLRQERLAQALERAEFRRRWLAGTVAILLLGLISTLLLYFQLRDSQTALSAALDRARHESERAIAAREFVMRLFRETGESAKEQNLTVRDILQRSAVQIRNHASGNPEEAAESLATLGKLYLHMSDYVSAEATFQRLFDFASNTNSPDRLAEARLDFAQVRIALGQPEAAQRLLQEANSHFRQNELRYRDDILRSRELEADIAFHHSDYPLAENILRATLEDRLRNPTSSPKDRSGTYSALATVYLRTQRFEAAREAYQHALRLITGTDLERGISEMNVLNGLGNVEYTLEQYPEAEQYFLRAIELERTLLGPSADLGNLLSNYGKASLLNDKASQALSAFHEADEMIRHYAGTESSIYIANNNGIAGALLAMGMHDKARALLLDTVEIAQRVFGEDYIRTAISKLWLAEAELALDEPVRARQLLDEAMPHLSANPGLSGYLRAKASRLQQELADIERP